ncbi:MAG TPA: gamma-glutamylcyclotransferase family protein [Victivallales bacterium]|nr:gamma-glutamylcyclotransferase family protein [Victivallales bacterium]
MRKYFNFKLLILLIFFSNCYNIFSEKIPTINSPDINNSDKILYFAYGSNMLLNRLKKRVPSAVPLGTALLEHYTLSCSKLSKDGSTKLSVKKGTEQDEVYGVLYEINANEKKSLDKAEGLKRGYEEMNINVLFKGKNVKAMTYYGTIENRNILPYKWYKAFVLAGARFHKFPSRYIKMILHSLAKNDLNSVRNKFNQDILHKN